jgi:hypothetical protein
VKLKVAPSGGNSDLDEALGRPRLGARGAELHEQFLAIKLHGGELLEARP